VILVFGRDGQLGRELARAAAMRAIPLHALSHAEGDIADATAVAAALSRVKPTLVVNAAAYTNVDLAETNIEQARLANEIGPAVLAQVCSETQLPLVHISTDYVFDGRKNGAYLETDQISPINAYGRTKAAGERAVRRTLARHVILRTSWVYSEFGQNFLKTILRLAATRDDLRVVVDQHGTPTSAREIADAILRIAPRLSQNEDVWGTYHFTSEGVTTWHGFACRAVAAQAPLTGHSPSITPIGAAEYPTPARRPANSQLDCSSFARVFGFSGRHWTESVDATAKALITSSQQVHHVA
jgi:dTDP-4-dehydrorhamnose reductase